MCFPYPQQPDFYENNNTFNPGETDVENLQEPILDIPEESDDEYNDESESTNSDNYVMTPEILAKVHICSLSYALKQQETASLEFIQDKMDDEWTLNWWCVSANPNITLEFVEKNINQAWHWHILSMNKGVTIDFVLTYPNKNWYWAALSSRIPLSDIEKNMHLPWIWASVSTNPTLTPEFIKKYYYKEWDLAATAQTLHKYKN